MTTGGDIRLEGLRLRYPGADGDAVAGIDLHVPAGEFFTLIGPSGCGKTTTLRLIAGFEAPDSGRILLDGADVARVPPERRPVNTVFQSYALFPHLSVADNVAFGLRFRDGVPRSAVAAKVAEALALVRLDGLGSRRPHQLSGGQQQRVALARALVLEPRVLLLDEPLGALDAKLRRELQVELKALQEAVGVTFVYVTHDQEEALTMSDRLAVLRDGRVEQEGPPRTVYDEPATAFVAEFLGVANLLRGAWAGPGCLRVGPSTLACTTGGADVAGGDVHVVVRPERVAVEPAGAQGPNRVPGVVERLVYLGPTTQVLVRLALGGTVTALVTTHGADHLRPGDHVVAHLPEDALRALPA